MISGRIDVDKAEITVPENLGGGAAYVPVHHKNTPKNVAGDADRARVETRKNKVPTPVARPTVPSVLMWWSVRQTRFSWRGRGLDIELGGRVCLTGPITKHQAGRFFLI